MIGLLASLTFRNKTQEEEDKLPLEETDTYGTMEFDEACLNEAKITKKSKIILGSLWFLASLLKAMGYYTPYLTLVSHTNFCYLLLIVCAKAYQSDIKDKFDSSCC